MRNADFEGQLAAIGKAQAVIEFDIDGTIRSVNDNFPQMGYTHEVRGNITACSSTTSDSGRADTARSGPSSIAAKRSRSVQAPAKGGRVVWVQASYNPILDANGRPFKVVKYATDVTEQMQMAQQLETAVKQTQITVKAAIDGDLTQRVSRSAARPASSRRCAAA